MQGLTRSGVLGVLLAGVVFSVLGGLPAPLQAQNAPEGHRLPIESTMRKFNQRYSAVNDGEEKQWPDRPGGSGGAGPTLPCDDYYGDLTEDPEFVCELVQEIIDCFYEAKLYEHFVCEGPQQPSSYSGPLNLTKRLVKFNLLSNNQVFTEDDFPKTWCDEEGVDGELPEDCVTPENCEEALDTICEYIGMLNTVADPDTGDLVDLTFEDDCKSGESGECGGGGIADDRQELGSVRSTVSLGTFGHDQQAGRLQIYAQAPSADLATPAGLRAFVHGDIDDVDDADGDNTNNVIRDMDNHLRQVYTGEVLADIVTTGDYTYEVRIYYPDQIGELAGGLYPINMDAVPKKAYLYANPNGVTDDDHLRVTELDHSGQVVTVSEYIYHEAADDPDAIEPYWELAEGLDPAALGQPDYLTSALRRTKRFRGDPDYFDRADIVAVMDGMGNPVSVTADYYIRLDWGEEELFERRVADRNDDSETRLSAWEYHADPGDVNNYGRLAGMMTHTGYWEHYTYGQHGMLARKISPIDEDLPHIYDLAAAPDGATITTLAENNMVTEYFKDVVTVGAAPDTEEVVVYKTVVTAAGAVDSVTYRLRRADSSVADCFEVWDVACATTNPEMNYGDDLESFVASLLDETNTDGHLIRRTWSYASGHPYAYRVKQVLNPDGTMQFMDYQTPAMGGETYRATRVSTGQPNDTQTAIEYGQASEALLDRRGQPFRRSVELIRPGVNGGDGVIQSLVETSTRDPYGRPETEDYYYGSEALARALDPSDGTPAYAMIRNHGCCGGVGMGSSTDRYGVITRYAYDRLGRMSKRVDADGSTHGARTTLYERDAAGRVTLMTRQPVAGSDPPDPSDDPADLVTARTYDRVGRVISVQSPTGRMTYYRYRLVRADASLYDDDPAYSNGVVYEETRVYGHDHSVPVQVSWTDFGGRTCLSFTASTDAAWDDQAPPVGDEALTQEHSRTVMLYDGRGRVIETRVYEDLTGLAIGLDAPGTEGTHYHTTTYAYDVLGRQTRMTGVLGDITETFYEPGTGRAAGVRAGTDPAALALVSRVFYREFADGDDADDPTGAFRPYPTRRYRLRPSLTTAPAEPLTTEGFTYTDTVEEVEVVDGLALLSRHMWQRPEHGPWSSQTTDAQGRVTQQSTYRNGSTTHLLGQSRTTYYPEDPADPDYLAVSAGRVRYTDVMEADGAGGSGGLTGHFLRTESFYDDAGRRVKTGSAGRGYRKMAYNAFGDVLREVFASGEGTTPDTYGTDAFTGDTVLTEVVYTYDSGNRRVLTTEYDRAHDASETGLLSAASAGQATAAYSAVWFDAHDRVTHTAWYGDNGNTALAYDPASPPAPDGSDGVVVAAVAFDAAGRLSVTTDHAGQQTRRFYNARNELTAVVEAWDGSPIDPAAPGLREVDENRVTTYQRNAAGLVTHQTAVDPDANGNLGDNQTTRYVYAAELADQGAPVPSNGRLRAVILPDSDDTVGDGVLDDGVDGVSDRRETTYYADGAPRSSTDPRGVAWTQTYTDAGYLGSRRASAPVGVVPAGSDLRYDYTYGDAGEVLTMTAYSAPGTPEAPPAPEDQTSSVTYEYDGFYNPTSETQGHHLTVQGVASEQEGAVGFSYDQTHTGAGTAYTHAYRPNQVTYPNGRQVELVYAGHDGIDSAISRANGIDEVVYGFSGTPVSTPVTRYTYLGSGTLVRKDLPGPGVRLDMIDEGSEGTEADDPYDASYDRLGRMVRTQWERYDLNGDGAGTSGEGEDIFLMEHGYNPVGRQTYDRRHVYTNDSTVSRLDGLHRITGYDRGPILLDALGEVDLTAGTSGGSGGGAIDDFWIVNGRDWHLNQLGNPVSVDTESSTARFATATNAANEIIARTSDASAPPLGLAMDFDQAGDADLFTGFINCGPANLGVDTTAEGVLTVDAGSAAAPAILLTGEPAGPRPLMTRLRVPAGTASGHVGLVLGYDYEDGSYDALLKNIQNGDWEVYHAHDADGSGAIDYSDSAEFELRGTLPMGGGGSAWHVLVTRPLSNTLNVLFPLASYAGQGGYPSGVCGLFVGVPGAEFDYLHGFVPGRAAPLSSAWDNRGANRVTELAPGDAKLHLGGTGEHSHLPVLLRHVRASRFEVTFSLERDGTNGSGSMGRLVFNARGPNDYDYLQMYHQGSAQAPQAYSVRGGEHRVGLLVDGAAGEVPTAAAATDTLWYRVVSDGAHVRVYGGTSAVDLDAKQGNDQWCMRTTDATDFFDFTGGGAGGASGGGRLGFMGDFHSAYVDNITVRTDVNGDVVDGAGFALTPALYETTEIVEDFDLTGGQLVDEAAYDAAGNLTFDGAQRLTYDASNRLVLVQNAYRDSGGAVVAGSTIAAYRYDANNRMIVEEQYTADGLDRIEHHYYLGHSLIETRDNAAFEGVDNGRVLSQSIWDSLVPGQYVDSLAQVAHNLDPGVDHDPATPEVEDLVDTRLYALQDVSGGYNILGLVNARGDLVERREYDLYGRMTVYHPAGLDFGEFAAADINGDGVIDLGDLVILINHFGDTSPSHADGDLNGDGWVDLGDLVSLTNHFNSVFRSENDPRVTAPSGGESGRLGYGLAQAGQSLCDFGFQGLRHLRGTSFADNRARVYDRHVGRFLQRDPLGYPDGMNGYAAYHVMHGGVDPTGRCLDVDVLKARATDLAAHLKRMVDAGTITEQQREAILAKFVIGAQALGELEDTLSSKCEDCCVSSETCDIEKCEEHARNICEAVANLWMNAFFTGEAGDSVIDGHGCGGYMCYEWSKFYKEEIDSVCDESVACMNISEGALQSRRLFRGNDGNLAQIVHFYVKINVCGNDSPNCTIYIDDGFNNGLYVHPQMWLDELIDEDDGTYLPLQPEDFDPPTEPQKNPLRPQEEGAR